MFSRNIRRRCRRVGSGRHAIFSGTDATPSATDRLNTLQTAVQYRPFTVLDSGHRERLGYIYGWPPTYLSDCFVIISCWRLSSSFAECTLQRLRRRLDGFERSQLMPELSYSTDSSIFSCPTLTSPRKNRHTHRLAYIASGHKSIMATESSPPLAIMEKTTTCNSNSHCHCRRQLHTANSRTLCRQTDPQQLWSQMLRCCRSYAVEPGPDLAGGRPGASWWEASAQLLHNQRHLNNTSPQTSWLLALRNREIYLTIQRWQRKLCKPGLAIELRGFKN